MIATQSVEERVAPMARRVAAREGCELVHCEYVNQSGRWILRLLIDREGGVTIDDCSRISRQMSAMLDVEDFIPQAYNLEVSSPGLDRPLNTPGDYDRFVGERIKVKTKDTVRGRRKFTGVLEKRDGEHIRVAESGGQTFEIPLEKVQRARLDPQL